MSKFVLDASALLALLLTEPGRDRVERAILDGCAMSTVNLVEVVTRLLDLGTPEDQVLGRLQAMPIDVVEFDAEQAYAAGLLRPLTRHAGLSLGDRACLALAQQLRQPALTAGRAWAALQIGAQIEVVR